MQANYDLIYCGSFLRVFRGANINLKFARSNKLITLELFEPTWEYALKTLELLPVTCMKAGTVEVEDYVKPEEMTEEDLSSEHYRLYYERDMKLALEATLLLERLCRLNFFISCSSTAMSTQASSVPTYVPGVA